MRVLGAILLILVIGVSFGLLMLHSHINTYQKYWQQRAAEAPAANSLTYVALGDSVAQGIGASQPQNGYVGLLADALGKRTGRPVHVTNLSVSGAKVQDALNQQLPELAKLALPKDAVITLDIGSNNMSSFKPVDFTQEMDQLLSKLPAQTVVADIPYFGGGREFRREPNVLKANVIIMALAAKYNLRLAHVHRATKDHQDIRDFAIDWFHPSDRAYQKWFKAFWEVV